MKAAVPQAFSRGGQAALWGIALLLALSLLVGAQDLPLREFREVRFAELGREMAEGGGDWILPHLNGSPYLNKPPMVGWFVALSFQAMGKSELAARIPNVLATLGTAMCVGSLVSMIIGSSWGVLGVTLFLGTPAAQYYGRMLSSDVVATFFMTAALVAFCSAILRCSRAWHLVGFGLCGMAVLCRGLTGVAYPVGGMFLFLLLLDRGKLKEIPWLGGGLVFLLVSLPWFLLVEMREPGFLAHHFVGQQMLRVVSDGGEPFVALSRWEVFLGFLGFLGPLAMLLPWAMTSTSGQAAVRAFLWTYGGLVVSSVLLSAGRNQPYTIPALPAVVALVGAWLAQPGRIRPRWGPALLMGILAVASAAGALLTKKILGGVSDRLLEPGLVIRVQVCMGIVALLLGASAIWLDRARRWGAAALVAAIMVPGGWMLSLVQGAMAPVESRQGLARWVSKNVPHEWPLVVADPRDRQFEGAAGWNFYSGRYVLMVRFQEPEQIRAQAPTLPPWIISMDELLRMWNSGEPLVLAATPEAVDLLCISGLPPPDAADGKFQLWVLKPRGGTAFMPARNPG